LELLPPHQGRRSPIDDDSDNNTNDNDANHCNTDDVTDDNDDNDDDGSDSDDNDDNYYLVKSCSFEVRDFCLRTKGVKVLLYM
jgi:hypothetical protein